MPVLPYSAEELSERITEQSVDQNRLAATVVGIQKSVAALADWANAQIQAYTQAKNPMQVPTQGQGPVANAGSPNDDTASRKRK